MRYFIKAATVGKGILFLLLAGLCIPSAAQKRLAVEAEHFRIEWQEKSDGYRISTVSTNSASGRISLENPSGSYGFLYSATKPDTVSLYETMPDYVRKFPGREYTLLYGRWRDNLRPVAMNTAGELVRFYPASAMQKGDSIIFTRKTRQGTLQAVWRPSKQFGSDIEVTMTLRAAVDGYFSLITPTLATLSEKEMAWGVIPGHFQGRKLEPNFVWSYGYGQGIPDRPVVVRERTATTLCPTLTDRQGLSFAVIPEPGQGRDPWTYDHSTQNEWRLGFSLMNRDRELTPSAYHPVLGQEDSYMRKGEIRSCTLPQYDDNYEADRFCSYRTWRPGEKDWDGDEEYDTNLKYAVEAEDWDVVTFMEYTGNSCCWSWTEEEKGHVNSLIDRVFAAHPEKRPTVLFMLTQTFAAQSDLVATYFDSDQMKMYETITDFAQQVLDDTCIDDVIATGTCIQNLRTSSLNDDPVQDLSRDGFHLDYGVSRYAAACTIFYTLFEPCLGLDLSGNTYRYDVKLEYSTAHSIPVTDENVEICRHAAHAAADHPLTLTDMSLY